MTLAEALIKEAGRYLGCKEDPNTPNRSSCVDVFKAEFDGSEIKNEAWCSEFVSYVLLRIMPFYLKFPFAMVSKSTLQLLDKAKKNGVVITDTPYVGSVFFVSRTGGGHVGFVSDIVWDDNGHIVSFNTIEGNAVFKDGSGEGVVAGSRKLAGKNYLFMNFETLSNLDVPKTLIFANWWEIFGGATALLGAFYVWKNGIQDSKKQLKKVF